ncbi:class I SAM-dependent methyltransferase [Lentilitoribacter sp. Alg239-R112]|uniref:class I SAM-dependent methyltransferase n=1 Tax=Lentilitoribacter sp. Alg239-R112 TaxID=2305987 RepID=UPI0013A6DFDD|nr:class I SAM-dependent methyltransferase [Lentilitoribacter sp. Alg239-R112]
MSERSKDYHDYVFRNGKLVGEFDAMYENSAKTPWNQDQQEDWFDVRVTKEFLHDLIPFSEIHDMGCGTGHYLELSRKNLGDTECKLVGYDISLNATKKAKALFPDNTYIVADLTGDEPISNDLMSSTQSSQRLFIIRGTLWYVFPKLDNVVKNICGLMKSNDLLLIVQNFPPLSNNFIGKEVIPNHLAIVDNFEPFFHLVRHMWYENTQKSANDNWFIGLFQKGKKNE